MKSLLLIAVLAAAPLVGCGAVPTEVPGPESFTVGIQHPYLTVTPDTVWIYEGHDEGVPRREEVFVAGMMEILGVHCTGIREHVFDDGVLVEVTTEWLAQDVDGHVWKFGEESFEFDGESFVPTADSWLGSEEALPWVILAARPQVGDVYAGYTPEGEDQIHVTSIDETAEVPAGTFANSVKMVENPDDEDDSDIILYSPKVGKVSEESAGGKIVLVSIEQR